MAKLFGLDITNIEGESNIFGKYCENPQKVH